MKKVFWLLGIFLVWAVSAQATIEKAQVIKALKGLPVPFIENQGQVNKQVAYYAKTFGGTVFVTKKGQLVYSLPAEKGGVALKEVFIGAKASTVKGEKKAVTKVSYFLGKDKKKWVSGLSTYEYVSLGEIWKGIELKVRAYGNNVEKLFYVAPQTGVNEIKIRLEGAKKLEVAKDGRLKAVTEKGEVYFTKPVAYQEIAGKKKEIKVAYVVKDKELSWFSGNWTN